jgi:hypothetical protein
VLEIGANVRSSTFPSDGKLKVYDHSRGKRLVERTVYLCDGMILVCKQMPCKPGSGSSGASQIKYRLIKKHLITRVDVLDREDSATEKYMFELAPREQPKLIFKASESTSEWF